MTPAKCVWRVWRIWRACSAIAVVLFAAVPAASAVAAQAEAQAQAQPACPPLPSVDQRAPRDRGLLWKLTGDGRVSYLFGTLHVGRPGWERYGPATLLALLSTDTVALELDPTDPATLAAMAEPSAGRAAAAALPSALQERLARAAERACLPPGALPALHPMLQATLLSLAEARWLGLDARYGFDAMLAVQARATGRRVRALETAAVQRAALLPADASDNGAAQVMQTLDQIDSGAARRVLTRLVDAWTDGDLAALEQYEAWCECAPDAEDKALMQRVNDGRNPALADGIAALHGQGRRVFAAVGALHMTGAQALPRLLAERGFQVERVAFSR